MSGDRLSELQRKILVLAAEIEPPWTLTGGGALAGFHTRLRPTRDLDLFWRDRGDLLDSPREVSERLRRAGLDVATVRTSPTFSQLRVSEGTATCTIDLVAEPGRSLEPPLHEQLGDAVIRVDSAHELLVNKLCALLSRSELRDLVDIEALLDLGGDLERAVTDAPKKDAGFSPLTLAWLLKSLQPGPMAAALDWPESDRQRLARFHHSLIDRILALSSPD